MYIKQSIQICSCIGCLLNEDYLIDTIHVCVCYYKYNTLFLRFLLWEILQTYIHQTQTIYLNKLEIKWEIKHTNWEGSI